MSIETTKPEVFLRQDLRSLTLMLFGPSIIGDGTRDVPDILVDIARRSQDAIDKLESRYDNIAAEGMTELQRVLNVTMVAYAKHPNTAGINLDNALNMLLSVTGYYEEKRSETLKPAAAAPV